MAVNKPRMSLKRYEMSKRSSLFFIFLVLFVITGEQLPGGTDAAFAQREVGYNRPSFKGGSEDASEDLESLLETEKESPTNSENVVERHRRLSNLLRSDPTARRALPREEAIEIRSLIRDGNLTEAAAKVHNAIMRLEKQLMNSRAPFDRQRVKRSTGPYFRPEAEPEPVVASDAVFRLNIHQLANKICFGNILKLHNAVIDSADRRLYFSGAKSLFLGVIDLDKDELVQTFYTGIPGGFLLFDSRTGDLFLFNVPIRQFYRIDVPGQQVTEVPSLPPYLSMPKKGAPVVFKGYSYKDTGYPFKAGYLQYENAAYGVIQIWNSAGKNVGQIKHGPEGLFFTIDPKTGKLYTTNTGDASISVFDLNNERKKIKDIDVGTSVDEIVLNSETGGLYIRNRLGGSTVFYYNRHSGNLTTIPNENMLGPQGIGMWPTQIIYDEDRLYVLSHYGGRIDVVETLTHKIVGRIELNLSLRPRTDGISTMVMDKSRKILYAAFPELGEIAVADARALKSEKILKVKSFQRGGPARIVLAVDEKLNKLFVCLPDEKILYVYNGNNYVRERAIPIDVGRIEKIVKSNSEKGIIYIGNRILDAKTLEEKGLFEKGKRVICFDNSKDRVYLTDTRKISGGKNVETVYEYVGPALTRKWILSPFFSIPSSFAFDLNNNRFYVGYFESAMIEAFDLNTDKTSTSGS